MRLPLVSACLFILSTTAAMAQSLKPEAPAPLQPGLNSGTVDNFVGTHYWYFMSNPGETHVHVQFRAMGLMGNPYRSDITVTLSDAEKTWSTPKVLSSENKPVDYTFTGQIKKPTKIIVSVAPPAGGLVRMGGNYELEATGAVAFAQPNLSDPVVGMYKEMSGYTVVLGDCKFLADGTIQTTSGTNGNWKLFDKDSQTYIINFEGQDRQSLLLKPGLGLVDGNGGTIVFQQVR